MARHGLAEARALPTCPQVLPAGTEVKLAFAQSLSSDHAVQGERVELRVAEDVTLGERLVIHAGARVLGTVTVGKKDERYGLGPGLSITLDYIVMPGRRVPLTGRGEWKRTGDIGRDAGSAIVFGVSGFLVSHYRRVARVEEGGRSPSASPRRMCRCSTRPPPTGMRRPHVRKRLRSPR